MHSQPAAADDDRFHTLQQWIKWTVYALLLINFGFYIVEDWTRALHTLHAGSGFLDWTSSFATTIDESAWFLLLLMFELETYVVDDRHWTRWVSRTVRGVRMVCFVMIAHTVFAFASTVRDYQATVPVESAGSLCELVDADVSYVYNLEYTAVTEQNCNNLSAAKQFYRLGKDPVVSDFAGLQLERDLAWADLLEVTIWLLILLAIEIIVRRQDKGIVAGPVVPALNRFKLLLYGSLLILGVYWSSLSHWLYTWDTLVWIGGFAAIEMNLSKWRAELEPKMSVFLKERAT